MSEGKVENGSASASEEDSPRLKNLRPPWPKGISGNPRGRPRIEPRVRRYARRYDRRMCKVLASIAEDEKAPWSERRRAAMDLVAIGSGRPTLVQEVAGRNGEELTPLVQMNFGSGGGRGELYGNMSPDQVYAAVIRGEMSTEAAGRHPAFQRQPPIDIAAAPTLTARPPVASPESSAAPAPSQAVTTPEPTQRQAEPEPPMPTAAEPSGPAAADPPPAPAPVPLPPQQCMHPEVLRVIGSLSFEGCDSLAIRRRAENVVRTRFKQEAALEREMGRPARAAELLVELAAMGLE
jgi:hypothetical protein